MTSSFVASVCDNFACLNGGLCQIIMGNPVCFCTNGFFGDNCECECHCLICSIVLIGKSSLFHAIFNI